MFTTFTLAEITSIIEVAYSYTVFLTSRSKVYCARVARHSKLQTMIKRAFFWLWSTVCSALMCVL